MSEDALTDAIGKGNYDMFQWDWGFGPDPDSTLSVFNCDSRSTEDGGAISAGWSDSFYCNPEYETLYKQQQGDGRPGAAQAGRRGGAEEPVRQRDVLHALLRQDSARRTATTGSPASFRSRAAGGAMASQLGTWTYRSITPYTGAVKKDTSNTGTFLWIGGGVLLVLIVGGVIMATRRRSTADERE